MSFLDAEEKMSVLFFKSLMCTFPEDDEEMQVIKKINRTLGFNYLKKCAQKDIYRKNKIIAENQGAYLLHCKILEKKLTNPSELDFLCWDKIYLIMSTYDPKLSQEYLRVHHGPVNNSKSKQMFSFSKQPRFKNRDYQL